jgi:hypothetical protein
VSKIAPQRPENLEIWMIPIARYLACCLQEDGSDYGKSWIRNAKYTIFPDEVISDGISLFKNRW